MSNYHQNDRGSNSNNSNRRDMQDNLTQRKIQKETEYFWTLFERNQKQNKRIHHHLEQEEKKLFSSQGNAGIKFDSYESIPVEKSGPHADAAPPMASFDDINDSLPDFIVANLQRMKYHLPTPIQKYAIPLALLGHDLMCSAQTVR
jgi:ATP-dependent RNA helicase DDX3X